MKMIFSEADKIIAITFIFLFLIFPHILAASHRRLREKKFALKFFLSLEIWQWTNLTSFRDNEIPSISICSSGLRHTHQFQPLPWQKATRASLQIRNTCSLKEHCNWNFFSRFQHVNHFLCRRPSVGPKPCYIGISICEVVH